ncbi:hypothetical protein [Pseudomonas sp.]|uniref:hypothetical protein n=1 Tax=Pseudomonas sp. TaxID=306 RepID=UPI003C321B22
MKIQITDLQEVLDAALVNFQSEIGNGTARWVGTTPKIGDELDVELDLDEVFSWGKNLIPSSRNAPYITVIGKVTHITAEIIQDSSEECTALKFADSIILIETDEPIPQPSGFVELRATNVYLYPTNL